MPRLSDVLPPEGVPLRVLFVGINPSTTSGRLGHHYAGPGNPFWRLVSAAGLVPVELRADQDARVAEWGLGLTNVCPRPTRAAADLSAEELARGRQALERKIRRLRPRVVAFVGLTIYQRFFAHKTSGGAGEKPERIHGARLFVLPNPSGLNASFPGFAHKLVWFERLREFIAAVEHGDEDDRAP